MQREDLNHYKISCDYLDMNDVGRILNKSRCKNLRWNEILTDYFVEFDASKESIVRVKKLLPKECYLARI